MITLLTEFKAKDQASSKSLAGILLELKQNTPSEPGCISYQLFSTKDDTKVFYIMEIWNSQEGIDAHINMVKQQGYIDKASDLTTGSFVTITLAEM